MKLKSIFKHFWSILFKVLLFVSVPCVLFLVSEELRENAIKIAPVGASLLVGAVFLAAYVSERENFLHSKFNKTR